MNAALVSPSSSADEIPKRLQAALFRVRADHPFFGALALFAEFRMTDTVDTAATDGRALWFNPAFIEKLSVPSLCGLLVHELLHAALQHVSRCGVRDSLLWNVAADVVVNGMIRTGTAYGLPAGAVEDAKLAHLSVEEIYEQYASHRQPPGKLLLVDLIPSPGLAERGAPGAGGVLAVERNRALQSHWRAAMQQASAVARRINKGFGRQGLDGVREYECAGSSQLSWKELLWQFMVVTPFDFGGFDRRHIHRKLYLEEMTGESVEVAICIDTSGSIDGPVLGEMMAEVQGILDAYPQIRGHLFFADATLYGPHEFSVDALLPAAKGGGGTDFRPFFRWLEKHTREGAEPMAIYFTDGYGQFPPATCSARTLWVVIDGGLETSGFPFGEVARMGVSSATFR